MEAKNKKILIISIAGTVVVVGTILVLRNMSKRKKLEQKIAAGSPDVLGTISEVQTEEIISWPLKMGSGYTNQKENDAVKVVQRAINAIITKSYAFKYIKLLEEDGKFGQATQDALYTITKVKEVSYSFWQDMYNYLAANAPVEQTQSVFQNPAYSLEGPQITFWDIFKSYFVR
jgi:hypothetical protein